MSDNIIFLNHYCTYDDKYDTLCNYLYKLLCQGYPFHEGINTYFLKHIQPDGFIKLEVLLNIFNNNTHFFKNVFQVLECSKLNEDDILMIKYHPSYSNKIDINKKKNFYLRSKYNHTIDIIDTSLIYQYELTNDLISKLRIFKRVHKDNLDNILLHGISNSGKKTIVLDTQYTQHQYQKLENEEDVWKSLEIDVKSLTDDFKIYLLDDKIILTNPEKNDFSINPSLISIYKHV